MAYGGNSPTVRITDVRSGEVVQRLQGHRRFSWGVAYTPSGDRVLSASADGRLGVWEARSGRCVRMLRGNQGAVKCVSVAPDGSLAVTGGADRSLRVWDLRRLSCRHVLQMHDGRVPGVALSPDGRLVASASVDHTVRLSRLSDGLCLGVLERHRNNANAVVIAPDGRKVLTAGRDQTLRLWSLRTGVCLRTYRAPGPWIAFVHVTAGGAHAVVVSPSAPLCVLNLETGEYDAVAGLGATDMAAPLDAHGRIAYATQQGTVGLLHSLGLPPEIPLVTGARLWLGSAEDGGGSWGEHVTVRCRWCGALIPMRADVLDVVGGIARDAALPEDASPCLELPEEAWEAPGLLSECPACGKPLQFNPFLVDQREWLG